MPLFFWFDLSLEARAEISEIFSLLFWDKQFFHKDILKLSDLYLWGKKYYISMIFTHALVICWFQVSSRDVSTVLLPMQNWKTFQKKIKDGILLWKLLYPFSSDCRASQTSFYKYPSRNLKTQWQVSLSPFSLIAVSTKI